MAVYSHSIRRIFARFFPRKYLASSPSDSWETVSGEERSNLALRALCQGELALLQGNLAALTHFETASQLEPENPQIWYRQGLAFFEYGSEEGREKALLLANKYFKIATQHAPCFFDAWVAWGNSLFQLGQFHAEHHFLIEAKEKYQKALDLAKGQPNEVLAELYWDYGNTWAEIAKHSGEALDVRLAIESFQISLQYQSTPSPEFLNDCGEAYLAMGLLVNDSRLYIQAIDFLQRSVNGSPNYFDGWATLAEALSQLYINTMDEQFVHKASEAFAAAVKIAPASREVQAELWLSWAQILTESGRLNDDSKLLRQAVEKVARAAALDAKNPLISAQWVESLAYLGLSTSRLDLLLEAENKALKAADRFPDDPDLWHAYGICLLQLGRYYSEGDYFEMAIEKLQYGLSLDRSSAEHWHALGLAHKLYANITHDPDLLERANRFLAKAVDLKPACPSLLFDTARTLLHFSEVTHDLATLESALYYFETLLQNHKEALLRHPEWLFEYGCAHAWLGDCTGESAHFYRAIEIFSHVLLIEPDFATIHHRIAICYVDLGHLNADTEFYKKAIHFFKLAIRNNEEEEQVWLDWGLCLIHLAHHTLDTDSMHQYYWDAEQKIAHAGTLGHPNAYYSLACLYSILGRTAEAMDLIRKALAARALPPIEEMLEDEWLDNLRATSSFTQFLSALEAKIQQIREDG